MFNKLKNMAIILTATLLLSACDEESKQVDQGKKLYEQESIGFTNAPGCPICHSLIKDFKLAGPSLYGIAERAKKAKAGMSAEEYIRESIVNPSIYVVDGFRHDVMYPYYGNDLEQEEIDNLIAFLLTQ